jgi:hypothetical protein
VASTILLGHDGVFGFEEHLPLCIHQQCPEGVVAVVARLLRDRDRAPKEEQIDWVHRQVPLISAEGAGYYSMGWGVPDKRATVAYMCVAGR